MQVIIHYHFRVYDYISELEDYDRFRTGKSQLFIENVKLTDRANYTCVAVNSVGNCTVSTLLRIRGDQNLLVHSFLVETGYQKQGICAIKTVIPLI